jgi:nucleotide-binding universal stress UspA family protein
VVSPCFGNLDARDAFHDMLFDERKLVLVPPCRPYAGNLLHHVVVCWKPNERVQRAVVAARRWLAAADRITVLCVDDGPDGHYAFTARELFTQVGLQAEIVSISAGKRPVGEAILDYAGDAQATCLVIGAFRYGLVLELLFGRVTRYLISHATIPLMMKH